MVILMILVDMITGIIKSKKQNIPLTSRKLSHTVSKILLYCGALIIVYGLDVALIGEFVALFTTIKLFITKGLACFLITVEIVSFHENFEGITGINLFNKFKQYLTRAKQIKDDITELKDENKG
jgi:phage-related holin